MKVVIIGAGKTGEQLAAKLCEESHDVVLIDRRAEALASAVATLNIMTLQGNGLSADLLEEAGVGRADLVAAVTDRDEVNILVGLMAHEAGAARIVVRVSDSEHMSGRRGYDGKRFGIDLMVNQHEECAQEVLRILSMRGTREVVNMVDGHMQVVGIKITADSPLLQGPLKDFPAPDLLAHVRLLAATRGDDLISARGDTVFELGDTVYCVGQPSDVRPFLDCVNPNLPTIERVVIAGGHAVGLNLAQNLEKTDVKVVLVEKDEGRAEECSSVLSRTLVLCGNALKTETLQEAGLSSDTAMVAGMGHDEDNMVACLLARKLGAGLTVALISKPEYLPIIDGSGMLDRAVSPYQSTINAILRFTRGTHVRAAALLQHVPVELLEVEVSANSQWVGASVKQLKLPKPAILAAVRRGDQAEIATGETILLAGDHLVISTPPEAAARVQAVFAK